MSSIYVCVLIIMMKGEGVVEKVVRLNPVLGPDGRELWALVMEL